MSFRFFRLILILALVALAPQTFGAMAQGLGQAPAGLVADPDPRRPPGPGE